MLAEHERFKTISFKSADELWDFLSPTQHAGIKRPSDLLFRGQGDAKWRLIPSVLRNHNDYKFGFDTVERDSFNQVLSEAIMLQRFITQCHRTGIRTPADGLPIRGALLNLDGMINSCLREPSKWPCEDVLDVMAMAQHHGVPTRLLDWSRLAYIAVYFAASSALASFEKWTPESKLAIWVLNETDTYICPDIKIYESAGSVSPHLAAQYGLFTVHPHNGVKGGNYDLFSLEDYFPNSSTKALIKLTLPVFESGKLLNYCTESGFSAGDIYPTPDGAGRGVIDECNHSNAKNKWSVQMK